MASIKLTPGELEAVLAVAASGSFRQAAQALNLAQGSVSSRIRHAEDVLGVKLFHRTTRKVVMTENGERLRHIAERTLAELRNVVDEFREEARLNRGRVVIGATPTLATALLPDVIRRFTRRRKGVEVVVLDNFQGRALDRVVSGAVDFAVLPLFRGDVRVRFEPLFTDEIVLVGPAQHPLLSRKSVTLEDCAAHPILAMSAQSALNAIVAEAFRAAGLNFAPAFEASETLSMLAMARAGHGVAFVSRMVVPSLNMDGLRTARLDPDGLYRRICLAVAQGRSFTPAAQSLVDEIRAAIGRMKSIVPEPPASQARTGSEARARSGAGSAVRS
jgi:DNA-binding transcriptional LysR family regulator